jgi:LmbE family N-acetylglucosaminyl deacetylase
MENQLVHVFLSPHLDDAVLSCGGLIRQLIKMNEKVLVVTIFAGNPGPIDAPSDLISRIHSLYGDQKDIVQVRRKEDELSIGSLGADFLHLDFPDCIYRRDEQTGGYYILASEDITGAVKEQDRALPEKIAARIRELFPEPDNIQLYSPAGIGGHIDHRLTYTASLLLKDSGSPLLLYEDYPYSENRKNIKKAYTVLSGDFKFKKQMIKLNRKEINLKINAIAYYQSQIKMLFGRMDSMHERVRKYSQKKGENLLIIQ